MTWNQKEGEKKNPAFLSVGVYFLSLGTALDIAASAIYMLLMD